MSMGIRTNRTKVIVAVAVAVLAVAVAITLGVQRRASAERDQNMAEYFSVARSYGISELAAVQYIGAHCDGDNRKAVEALVDDDGARIPASDDGRMAMFMRLHRTGEQWWCPK